MSRSRRSSFTPISIERVVVRGVSSAFSRCERSDRTVPIDVDLARAQHGAYVAMLRRVAQVIELPSSDLQPDCVFVEDTAVMLDDATAVLTRPGAASRHGEVAATGDALRALGIRLAVMEPPARLDGGDVLRIGARLIIGLSERTSEAGAKMLADAARERGIESSIVRLAVGLHLKSSCSLADEGTLLVAEHCPIDEQVASEAGVRRVVVDEPLGANVLALGGGRVVVSTASPRTARLLQERGLHVQTIDISELHKADGALTCPSLRIPAPGAWCT